MFADKKSMHGMTCGQGFVNLEGFLKVYPMRTKGDASDDINKVCITIGLPLTLVTDNAEEKYGGNWEIARKKFLL